MSDYKLVPYHPTPEMVEAAEDAHMPFGDMDMALRMAILAAPEQQGEPVAWSGWGCQYPGKMPRLYGDRRLAELNCDWENGDQVLHFTAAAQPAGQQPINPNLAFDASVHLTNWLNMNWCECEGAHTCGYNEVKRTRDALLEAAEQRPVEQQPEPDVAALVEALELAAKALALAGLEGEVTRRIDAAIAAHRKGGGQP